MDAREETLGLLNKIWLKLQGLPKAHPAELGAFLIILTFICESLCSNTFLVSFKSLLIVTVLMCSSSVMVLLMMALTCVSCCCCCCRKTKMKGPNV